MGDDDSNDILVESRQLSGAEESDQSGDEEDDKSLNTKKQAPLVK